MKKLFLSLAVIASMTMISCKETTEDKVEDATEAVGEDIEMNVDHAGHVMDSTATEVGNDIKDATKEGAESVEEKAREVKNEM